MKRIYELFKRLFNTKLGECVINEEEEFKPKWYVADNNAPNIDKESAKRVHRRLLKKLKEMRG